MSRAALLIVFALASFASNAHDLRPAYLSIKQDPEGTTSFEFRQSETPSRKWLIADSSCKRLNEPAVTRTASTLIQSWQAQCEPGTEFVVSIIGLAQTTIDVLVDYRATGADAVSFVIRPEQPSVAVGKRAAPALPIYLSLGISHLLSGYDHLLFLVGLMLLVSSPWMLVKTITSFTVAHSITLALATLNIVNLPQAPVEAAIALSIIYVAFEVTIAWDKPSHTMRYPWQIAFLFGLLHGLGFAGVLREIGLPDGQFVSALLLFNLGIEAGQLIVIGIILAVVWVVRRQAPVLVKAVPVSLATAYVIGSTGVFWLLQRVASL